MIDIEKFVSSSKEKDKKPSYVFLLEKRITDKSKWKSYRTNDDDVLAISSINSLYSANWPLNIERIIETSKPVEYMPWVEPVHSFD